MTAMLTILAVRAALQSLVVGAFNDSLLGVNRVNMTSRAES